MLFLRDPAIQLFSFAVDAAPLPPPAPMDLLIPSVASLARPDAGAVARRRRAARTSPRWPSAI